MMQSRAKGFGKAAMPGCFMLLVASSLAGCTMIDPGSASDPRAPLAAGMLSSKLGAGLDKASLRNAVNAEYQALEKGSAGAAVRWQGKAGISGFVTPGPRYQIVGQTCRRYSHSIIIAGETRAADATACRDEEGRWLPFD